MVSKGCAAIQALLNIKSILKVWDVTFETELIIYSSHLFFKWLPALVPICNYAYGSNCPLQKRKSRYYYCYVDEMASTCRQNCTKQQKPTVYIEMSKQGIGSVCHTNSSSHKGHSRLNWLQYSLAL